MTILIWLSIKTHDNSTVDILQAKFEIPGLCFVCLKEGLYSDNIDDACMLR